ncbi:MAG: hypothetical protein ACRDGM_16100 [bacterium]
MAHQLSFGKIHIIEWLWTINPETGNPDRRTGQESLEEIRAMLAAAPDSPVQVILHRVSSRASFLARLNRIEQDFRVSGRVPLLQIETHGNGDGIGLSHDDGLTWPELMKALTPLNQATGVRLPVFLAACDGMWGIRMAQAMERAPFFALLGPNREVTPGEVVRGMRAFYRKVILDRDGLRAMDAMNNIVDPDKETFRIYNCEQLFRDVWGWYLEGTSTEEHIAPRIDEAEARAQAERPRTPAEIAHLRAYMRDYILDYQARFEESRRHFFMIDLYPHNHARFNLLLTPAGQGARIAEA